MSIKVSRGYQTIVSVSEGKEKDVKITFANRDIIRLNCDQFVRSNTRAIWWCDMLVGSKGMHIVIPALPDNIEVHWTTIRCLSDPKFADQMVAIAVEQAKLLGSRLRVLRERRELTQAKLAARANIQVSILSRLENGKIDIASSTLWKLLAAMAYTTADLVSD